VFINGTTEVQGSSQAVTRRFIALAGGPIFRGLGGAPLLNTATGEVCGHVGIAAGSSSDHGVGISIRATLDVLTGLSRRNHAYHSKDLSWNEAFLREKDIRQLLAGARHQVALAEPRLQLDDKFDGSRADLLHPRYGVVPF